MDNEEMHRIICSNNLEALPRFQKSTVDLCVTSPPYAGQRKRHYDSVSEADYPVFTLRWFDAVGRVLKPTGSICVVIRSHIKDGRVSPYVLRTRLHLEDAGWHECQEIVWHKPGSIPTGRRDRCRQEFEQVLWFSRNPKIVFCSPKANGKVRKESPDFSGRHDKFRYHSPEQKAKKAVAQGRIDQVPAKALLGKIARSADVIAARTSSIKGVSYNNHPAQHPGRLRHDGQFGRIMASRSGIGRPRG